MLRRALLHNQASHLATKRWMTAAAGTSRQKRALNPDQLHGSKNAADGAPTPSPPAATTPPPSSGSGNSTPLVIAALGAVAGGAAYFYATSNGTEQEGSQPVKSSEASLPAKNDDGSSANKVREVQIPPGMKNTTGKTVPVTEHPEGGNRVDVRLEKPKTPTNVHDSRMTDNAIASLVGSRTEESAKSLLESHQSAWSSMDAAYFQDLDSLSMSQLKARVVQLSTEIKDRTRWEAVRLKEFLTMKEKESEAMYMEALQKQRLEYEDMLAKKIREKEFEYSDRMRKSLEDKDATIQEVISAALATQKSEHEEEMKTFEEITAVEIKTKLESEYSNKLADIIEQSTNDLQHKADAIKALTEKLSQLESALEASQSRKEGSDKAHRLSAAALALSEKLETSQNAEAELKALKAAAGKDGVIATALSTIPDSVKSGVPTVSELQKRFEMVFKKARQAALVPAGRPGLEGQLAGMVFSAVRYAPDPDEPAPENEKDSAEFVLARAKKYVELGELELAVQQLQALTGQAEFTVADWKKDALNRICVEKALKAIKFECALLNKSLVSQ